MSKRGEKASNRKICRQETLSWEAGKERRKKKRNDQSDEEEIHNLLAVTGPFEKRRTFKKTKGRQQPVTAQANGAENQEITKQAEKATLWRWHKWRRRLAFTAPKTRA
jgi:hypothetical protein